MQPLIGDSVHHPEKFDWSAVKHVATLAEICWALQAGGDQENATTLDGAYALMAEHFDALISAMQNFNAREQMNANKFVDLSRSLGLTLSELDLYAPLKKRLGVFLEEARRFVEAVESGDLEDVRRVMQDSVHLFKGAIGVRHVDFIGYRPL
jgi:DNA-binding GntR family transcriptional regulator